MFLSLSPLLRIAQLCLQTLLTWDLCRHIRRVIGTRRTFLEKRRLYVVSVRREGTLRELKKAKICSVESIGCGDPWG